MEEDIFIDDSKPEVDDLIPKRRIPSGLIMGLIILILVGLLVLSIASEGFKCILTPEDQKPIPMDIALERAGNFINANLLQAKSAEIINATEKDGIYELTVVVENKTLIFFINKDATYIFQQGIEIR